MRWHPDRPALMKSFVAWTDDDVEQSIAERFQQQVARDPERLLMKAGGRCHTFGEMNRWANRLAREIRRRRGEGSEPVIVCFENGPGHIASLLGVLKAGKFYVILDATMPLKRMRYILEDSGAALILSDSEHIDKVRRLGTREDQILNVEKVDRSLSGDDLDLPIAPEEMAYILYTSGSTGRPKGVMQTHRYVLNLVRCYTNGGLFRAEDRFALLSSPIFAGAVRDTYCALLNGAPLFPYLAKREGLANLARWLVDEKINLLFMVPTAFRHFCKMLNGDVTFPDLRFLLLVSEPIYRRDVDLYKQHFDDECVLAATLGSSECSPVTQFFIDKSTEIPGRLVPVGYPPESHTITIVDDAGRPAPPGEIGEIVIRGRYLSTGYWKRPDMNAERFVPDPDGGDRRLLMIGDLGTMSADGCLTHAGRKDFQVQIRGYRVETGEVETVLLETGLAREAVVTAAPDHAGELQLVAYIVPASPGEPPSLREVRARVAESLPDYMLPARLVHMESFPLTPSGKIKRRALPDPSQFSSEQDTEFVAPDTPAERKLAAMWEEVLARKSIGTRANFFEIGGHSLLAGQVIVRIRDTFHVEVPLETIFDKPTIGELAAWIDQAPVLDSPAEATLDVVTIEDRTEPQPISVAQQRLWLLEQLIRDKAAFNLVRAFHLEGTIDVPCLEEAVRAILARHETLRTTFDMHGERPVQVIAPEVPFALEIEDLREMSEDVCAQRSREIVAEYARRPFDLKRGPLLRMMLIRRGETTSTLLVAMHHVTSDDWSMQVFLRELSAQYSARLESEPVSVPDFAFQYVDHAAWLRGRLESGQLSSQLEYWRRQLEGASFELELPRDRAHAPAAEHRGRTVPFHFDADVTHRLQEVSRESRGTLFITLLATYAALLSRYCGQEELLIGTPIANRNPIASELLIGFFVNSLALRIRVDGAMTFRELLADVRRVALEAYTHSEFPFDQVVRSLALDRQAGFGPLFQTMFVLQNVPKEELKLPGVTSTLMDLDKTTAGSTFDLMLSLLEVEGELKGAFEYDANLFDRATVKRMVRHFQALVTLAAENPDRPLCELPLLEDEERRRLLVDWNDTRTCYPREACIQELFEAQAARTPDTVAVQFEGQRLTYDELNRRANRVAHHLIRLGVSREVKVGVALERSVELVVGILGVLKAGGAYVPLDPSYPKSRLAYMVEDTRAPVVLTQEHLVANLPEHDGVVVCLDADRDSIASESEENPGVRSSAEDLAYVMYTSGSTGRPKGSSIVHRSIVRLVKETNFIEISPSDVYLQFAPVSFDASTLELWAPLLNGAKLVVFPPKTPSLEELGRAIERHGVTTLWLTGALFQQMVDAQAGSLRNVRQLLAGGDALSVPHVRRVIEDLDGDRVLINGYGPTENTTFTCCHVMGTGSRFERSVPIGRPIANTQVYILDRWMEPVPVGVPGELYAGGDGLAREYLNDPELTAQKLVPNPFGEEPGSRLYRTGDRARYLPDGTIEFLGRIDFQVKIRGFRIELGEIDTALLGHEAVQEAAVLCREDKPGNKYLTAYVVADRGQSEASLRGELRHFLQGSLPSYMVPTAFVFLESLPLNPNGKLDRRALPAPTDERQAEGDYVAPRSALEEQIAAIWCKTLDVERVGVRDNFFELGGHSLLATQLISRVRDAVGIDLNLDEFFDDPTVAGVAEKIDAVRWAREDPGDVGSAIGDEEEIEL